MRKADLIAGLSMAGLMVPEAVAYAAVAGLPPQRALFAGIAGGLAYAIFGRSRFAIVSTTSSAAAILAAILATLSVSAEMKADLATATVLLTGLFFGLASALRLGGLTGLIARPVLRGFALGLGLTIILKQLPAIVGTPIHAPNIFLLVYDLFNAMPLWNDISIALGLLALAGLLLLKRLPALPGAFLVLACGIAASIALNLPGLGVAIVGPIDTSLPLPHLPVFAPEQWSRLAQLTLPLAMIVFAESWGTISSLALRHADEVSANRELAALSAANFASALVQGMPVGAGFSAGSAAEAAGAQTRLTAVIAALGLAGLMAFATPLIAHLPEPVLAAVVIAALTHALNPAPFLRLWQIKRDFALALAAALAVLVLGVLNGMLVAIALSLAMVLRRLASPIVVRLGRLGTSHDFVDVARHEDANAPAGIGIWRPAEPLIFANAELVFRTIGAQARATAGLRAVIVSLEESFDLDSTTLEVLAAFDQAMQQADKNVVLARVHDQVRDVLTNAGMTSLLQRCSYSVDGAVQLLEQTA